MTSSVNFVQPDVTLRLDLGGVIRRAALSNVLSPERVDEWVGRPWEETVVDGGLEHVRKMVADARTLGVSSFHQVRQRFPTGRELAIEYTTVRLGGQGGLLAIGRNLEVVAELRSRLVAAQASMERDYWKLREVETRYRLLFDSSTQPVLLVQVEDLRIAEANPAAIRALGIGTGSELLPEILAAQREPFRAMLARVREQGKAPGVVVHLGNDRSAWLVRASLVAAEPAAVFVLQLSPSGGTSLQVDAVPPVVADGPAADKVAIDELPVRVAIEPLGAGTLREIIHEKVAAIERQCIEAALSRSKGNRSVAAQKLGLSRQSLYTKINRYASLDGETAGRKK